MVNRTKCTPTRKDAFIMALRALPNVTKAVKTAGLARRTVYEWKKDDPEFAQQWEDAIEAWVDDAVEECRRRAVDGTDKPVFYQGNVCGYIREYSDDLLKYYISAHRLQFRSNNNTPPEEVCRTSKRAEQPADEITEQDLEGMTDADLIAIEQASRGQQGSN